jgi:hypothetical protein
VLGESSLGVDRIVGGGGGAALGFRVGDARIGMERVR